MFWCPLMHHLPSFSLKEWTVIFTSNGRKIQQTLQIEVAEKLFTFIKVKEGHLRVATKDGGACLSSVKNKIFWWFSVLLLHLSKNILWDTFHKDTSRRGNDRTNEFDQDKLGKRKTTPEVTKCVCVTSRPPASPNRTITHWMRLYQMNVFCYLCSHCKSCSDAEVWHTKLYINQMVSF